MKPKRVLIVDDSSIYQRILSEVIDEHPHLEVAGVAVDGRDALQCVEALEPDVVTLDILMPQMDGIQTLMELRKRWPSVRTIMISSLTSEGSEAALDALTLGAHDYAVKPVPTGGTRSISDALRKDLLPKIEALCGLESLNRVTPSIYAPSPSVSVTNRDSITATRKKVGIALPKVVVIGISTGGPDALTRLMLQLPGDLDVPVFIVQHMPAEFTGKLAARLDATGALSVSEAKDGEIAMPAHVYIAPGDWHMVLERSGTQDMIRLNRNPPENSCRPSADPLFRSAAEIHGARCLGVVMTGMGQDGLKGSEVLYAAGATILVQDEASSVVWGMPKLVANAGLADEQVPLQSMAKVIVEYVRGHANPMMTRTVRPQGPVVSPGMERRSYDS